MVAASAAAPAAQEAPTLETIAKILILIRKKVLTKA